MIIEIDYGKDLPGEIGGGKIQPPPRFAGTKQTINTDEIECIFPVRSDLTGPEFLRLAPKKALNPWEGECLFNLVKELGVRVLPQLEAGKHVFFAGVVGKGEVIENTSAEEREIGKDGKPTGRMIPVTRVTKVDVDMIFELYGIPAESVKLVSRCFRLTNAGRFMFNQRCGFAVYKG